MKQTKRKLKEIEMQSRWTKWVKENPKDVERVFGREWHSIAYELKVGGLTLAFSQVQEHQEIALLKACGKVGEWFPVLDGKVLNHKISDGAQGFKPFDGFMMRGADAYLVIGFHGGHDWVAIEIGEWMMYKRSKGKNGRGSISYEDALRWGFRVN